MYLHLEKHVTLTISTVKYSSFMNIMIYKLLFHYEYVKVTLVVMILVKLYIKVM